MNKYLLDTHTYMWWAQVPPVLTFQVQEILEDTDNQLFVSVASIWEMIIKRKKGRLTFDEVLLDPSKVYGFKVLSIDLSHVVQIDELDMIPHDPFDRVMLAQALKEKLTFITNDAKCLQYTHPELKLLKAGR